MHRTKAHSRRCRCGKTPFYSEQAAAYALANAQRRSMLDETRRECRLYECDGDDGIWHLTSMTEAQHNRRTRLWALCALQQWAAPTTFTMRVRPGCRLPNRNLVRVTIRSDRIPI